MSTRYNSSQSVTSHIANKGQHQSLHHHTHNAVPVNDAASHLLINDLILSKKHEINKISTKTKLQQQGDVNVATVLSVKH